MNRFAAQNFRGTFCGEVADAHEPFGLKNADDLAQMLVACGEEYRAFARRQFIRRAVPSAALEESERAVVYHEMFGEEVVGAAESVGEQFPQALAADLAPRAGESGHGPFGMFVRGPANFCFNLEPIAHGRDLAKWDAGLRHAERTRVHAEKQNALLVARVTAQINLVRGPGVIERVVNVRDRRREDEFAYRRAQFLRSAD